MQHDILEKVFTHPSITKGNDIDVGQGNQGTKRNQNIQIIINGTSYRRGGLKQKDIRELHFLFGNSLNLVKKDDLAECNKT